MSGWVSYDIWDGHGRHYSRNVKRKVLCNKEERYKTVNERLRASERGSCQEGG